MKLMITIVQNDDVSSLLSAIVESGHSATKLSSSGGLLRNGNTTLLIGVEESDVDEMLEIIRSTCRQRSIKVPNNMGMGESLDYRMRSGYEVTVGGATVFIVDVDKFIHL